MLTPRATSRDNVHAHLERLRSQALRPFQFRVPDTLSQEFRAKKKRE